MKDRKKLQGQILPEAFYSFFIDKLFNSKWWGTDEEVRFTSKWILALIVSVYLMFGMSRYKPELLKVFFWPFHESEMRINEILER